MAAKKPYEQFGPYLLFKKLESDSLSELWRAARIEGQQLEEFVALRRFTGGHRTALMDRAAEARAIVPLLQGTSFVKHQVIDIADGLPFIAHEYSGGRSIRHIVTAARGIGGAPANPVPIDQAVLVSDRIALGLAATSEMRHDGKRLSHGALIPQLVWVTDDGEVRIAGQHLGHGIRASLSDPKVNGEIGRYFSPEAHGAAEPGKTAEVYSMGAILFLLVTGHEPPDPLSVSAFSQNVRAAKTMTGQPIPLEIRTILDKSLILDPSSRYPSINDMKQALSAAASKYSATTFNLAFYLSTLLKKELEAEVAERDRESKVSLAAYTAAPAPVEAAPVWTAPEPEPARSRTPMFAIAAIVVVLAGVAAAFVYMRKPSPPEQPATTVTTSSDAKPAPELAPPVLASTMPINATPGLAPATASADPAAQKKAFEDAVNRKYQEEMLKLQTSFNRELQQKKTKDAPVVTAAPPAVAESRTAPVVEERAPSAAALDERRAAARTETQPVPQPVEQPVAAPTPAPAPVQQPVEQPVARTVQEGDVVDLADLDTVPRALRQPVVTYPPMAARQRVETSVIVTALVSENGDVVDVRVLRGDARFGFNEAAMRALRGAKFTSPIKDGKRVKTWWPQTINFKL